MNEQLKTKLENYCKALEEVMVNKYPQCEINHYKYTFKEMRKFIKIIQCSHLGVEKSVFCFVDFDGNLYKAECWSKPASGIRGHIDKPILSLGGFYR